MLEVVQDEEQLPVAQRGDQPFADWSLPMLPQAKGLSDRGRNEVRVSHGGERNEGHAVGKVGHQILGHPKGQPRLAGPTGTGQREQAQVGPAQRGSHRANVALPTQEGRQGVR